MFYEGINTKAFRHSIAFAIAKVVTSRSSSSEYTISVHAVHEGAGKTSVYFLCFDIKLKKSRSEFDLVTVLVSKPSFFQHQIWPV